MALLPSYLSGNIASWVGDQTPIGYNWEDNPQRLDPLAGYNYWSLNPEFAAFDQGLVKQQPTGLAGSVEMEVIGQNPDGSWIVGRKTGDKEFSAFQYSPDGQGGFTLGDKPLYTYEKDTNFADPMMYAMLAAAAVPGVAQLFGLPTTMPAIGGVGEIASMGPGFATLGGTGSGAAGALGGAAAGGAAGSALTNPGAALDLSSTFLGADPAILQAAGIDTGLTSAAMGGSNLLTAPGAMNAALGFGGASLADLAIGAGAGLAGPGAAAAAGATGAALGAGAAGGAASGAAGAGTAAGAGAAGGAAAGAAGTITGNAIIDALIKYGTPILGGAALAYEANQSNGQQNPQDPWSRDYLRGLLTGPQSSNQSSGLLGTIGQLQGKKYY